MLTLTNHQKYIASQTKPIEKALKRIENLAEGDPVLVKFVNKHRELLTKLKDTAIMIDEKKER